MRKSTLLSVLGLAALHMGGEYPTLPTGITVHNRNGNRTITGQGKKLQLTPKQLKTRAKAKAAKKARRAQRAAA